MTNLAQRLVVQAPQKLTQEKQPSVIRREEIYEGPRVEDLRREADEFRAGFEKEKEAMLAAARAEAEQIVKEAEERAFQEVKRKTEEAQNLREEAEQEAALIIDGARRNADDVNAEIEKQAEQVRKAAYEEGLSSGREEGYSDGAAEVERLTERLHLILSKAIEKRAEIIQESETQLVNLVLLIAKKVIKVISDNQKSVVINNVIQALRKLKTRTDVIIRVNTADLKLTSQHVKDFLRLVENAKNITVMEDTAVDTGGCIIETDFGLIDARISSQLSEIEEKILTLMPMRSSGKHEKDGVEV